MNSTLVDIAQRFGTPCYVYWLMLDSRVLSDQ
jgi:hypothetical protein